MPIGKNQPGCCCAKDPCPCGPIPCGVFSEYGIYRNDTKVDDVFVLTKTGNCYQWNSTNNTYIIDCDQITGQGWRLRAYEYGSFVRYYFSTGTSSCTPGHAVITLPIPPGGNYTGNYIIKA